MPGFIAKTGKHEEGSVFQNTTLAKGNKVSDFIQTDDFYVERLTVNKFMNDKIFFDDDDLLILIEGVVVNSHSLISKYKAESFKDCIIEMYKTNGETFFNEFRGSFCGIFIDKINNLKLIYTGQVGDKQIFYADHGRDYLFTSDMLYMAEYLKANNLPRSLDIKGAYFLVMLGYMFEDTTLFNEVKRLMPGHYIRIKDGAFEIRRYYKLKFNYDYNLTEDEIIDKLDELFISAVKMNFEKDKEYGYEHLADLSSGLDSRMTTFVAHELGYGPSITNNTVSQTGYWDEIVAKEIASDLRHKWIFKSLDNGIFLIDIEKNIKITAGMSLLNGCAHVAHSYDSLNMDIFGAVQTGQLGDAIVGTFAKSKKELRKVNAIKSILHSRLIDINRRVKTTPMLDYDNGEDIKFFNYGLLCTNQGLLARQKHNEVLSPYLNVDFMEFCFKIPLEYRMNNHLRYNWIIQKHPAAANYIYDNLNANIKEKRITLFNKEVPVSRVPIFLYERMLKNVNPEKAKATSSYSLYNKNHMNPFDYWYSTNERLKAAIDGYYKKNIHLLKKYSPDLSNDCTAIFNYGNVTEKTMVLTLLGMLKMYF